MSFGKIASSFALLAALFYVPGCGPDCRLLCEEQEEADCAGATSDVPDCERMCKHQLDVVTNADCQGDWDAYIICVDELENICDAYLEPCTDPNDCDDPKCDNELEELQECLSEYCAENPRNNECENGVPGGFPPAATPL